MRTTRRSLPRRRWVTGLVGVALVLPVAGCGDGGTATDPAASPSSSTASPSDRPTLEPPGETQPSKVLAILSGTAAGGRPDGVVVPLETRTDVLAFVEQFGDHPLARDVRRAATGVDVPPGMVLVGSVVWLGCDIPTAVRVETQPLRLVAEPVPSPLQECLAPVTSVALALVDAMLVERTADPGQT